MAVGGQKRLIIFNTSIFTGKGDISIWAKKEIRAGPKQLSNQEPNNNSQIPTLRLNVPVFIYEWQQFRLFYTTDRWENRRILEESLPQVQACEILDWLINWLIDWLIDWLCFTPYRQYSSRIHNGDRRIESTLLSEFSSWTDFFHHVVLNLSINVAK